MNEQELKQAMEEMEALIRIEMTKDEFDQLLNDMEREFNNHK